MKLLIDIPKEFEQHFQADRFDDSLHRLSTDAHLLAGLYEQESLYRAGVPAIPAPCSRAWKAPPRRPAPRRPAPPGRPRSRPGTVALIEIKATHPPPRPPAFQTPP